MDFGLKTLDVEDVEKKYNISAVKELIDPIIVEVEGEQEIQQLKDENDDIDDIFVRI